MWMDETHRIEVDGDKIYAVRRSAARTAHHPVPEQDMYQRLDSAVSKPRSVWYGTKAAADSKFISRRP